MHPAQAERRILVIGARLDFGAHARQRHPMDTFEVVAIAPLNRVGASEVSAENRAIPFERRETLLDFRFLEMQSRRDFAGGRRAAGFQRAADEFGARSVAVGRRLVVGGREDRLVFGWQ